LKKHQLTLIDRFYFVCGIIVMGLILGSYFPENEKLTLFIPLYLGLTLPFLVIFNVRIYVFMQLILWSAIGYACFRNPDQKSFSPPLEKVQIHARCLENKVSQKGPTFMRIEVTKVQHELRRFTSFLFSKSALPEVLPGDQFSAWVSLKKNKYQQKGEPKTMAFLSKPTHLKKISNHPWRNIYQYETASRLLTIDTTGITSALLTANNRFIESSVLAHLKTAGIYHLFVVSGYHFTLIAVLLVLCFRFPLFWLSRESANCYAQLIPIPVILALLLYLKALNFPPSAVRSTLFCLLYFLGNLFFRRQKLPHIIIVSFVLLAIFYPPFLFSISFQLTYAATAGICFIALPLTQRFRFKNRMVQLMVHSCIVSTSAWLCILPFVLYYFNSLTPYFLPMNLIATPPVSFLILPTSVAMLFTDLMSPSLTDALGQGLGFIHLVLVAISTTFNSLPFAQIQVPFSKAMAFLLFALILELTFWVQKIKLRKGVKLSHRLAILMLLLFIAWENISP
jgi:ComEC/Rec2-related protein